MRYKNITVYSETDRDDDELIEIVEAALIKAGRIGIHDIDVTEVED